MIDRRRFLERLGAAAAATSLLTACNSYGPKWAQGLLGFAERENEGVERLLFRHTSMDAVGRYAKNAGAAFPMYFIADTVPMWDERANGVWRLEVSGSVAAPRSFTLDELARLPSVTQRVHHYCVEGWTAVASWTGVRLSDLAAIVRPAPEARYVDFQSFDNGYHES